jgi:hypothetical protein
MNRFTVILFLSLTSGVSFAQKKITTIYVSDTVVAASVDRPGELYVVLRDGQIQKFDVQGKVLTVYRHDPVPTLFDPRDGARLFAYYRGDQHYAFLNPSLDVTASYQVDPSFVISPWLICTSGDHGLWILDQADNSLKKVNMTNNIAQVDTRIPGDVIKDASEVTFMRDYQGFLFVLDRTRGIHVFNAIGHWIRTIAAPNLPYFNFLGEELYYRNGDNLTFFNLFTTETRSSKSLPAGLVLLTDERMYIISGTQIDFYPALSR